MITKEYLWAAFEERVHRIPDCECWLWGGHLNERHRYGEIQLARGERWRAHRLSYFLHKGPLVDGLVIMHSCDNPWCVNPAHLSQGTSAQNMMDSVQKRRHPMQQRTHCPSGHPLSGENLRLETGGRHRRCRACTVAHVARQRGKSTVDIEATAR
jgi:hypothetical protein